jgi:hypothetical protein
MPKPKRSAVEMIDSFIEDRGRFGKRIKDSNCVTPSGNLCTPARAAAFRLKVLALALTR